MCDKHIWIESIPISNCEIPDWLLSVLIVTLPLVGLWCLWSTQFTSSLHKLCPFPSQIFIYSSTEMFSSSVMVCLTVGFIRWTCLMPYYILQIFKKKHYCSKQKTNKFIQHYTFLWFIFFFRFKEDRGTFEFPCLYLFSVNSLILISLSLFYVVDLSSFSNLNSYVVLMLVFSYLQSCYLFEITWPRVCVKLTNLYLPESIHLFQVFFCG